MTATTNEQHTENATQETQGQGQEPLNGVPPNVGPSEPSEALQADIAPIMPDAANLEVEGIPVRVRRIKSREFFTVVRIISNGMGPAITSIRLDVNDPDALRSSLTAVLLYAVPNAIDEFGLFLTQITEARNPKQKKDLDKALENPDLDTLFEVLAVMVEQEKDDFRSLMGKAQAWFNARITNPATD